MYLLTNIKNNYDNYYNNSGPIASTLENISRRCGIHKVLLSENTNVSSSFNNQHWTVEFNNNNKNSKWNVSFDIVAGFGNDYGRFQRFKEYGNLHGLSKYEIDKVAADIDICDKGLHGLYNEW